MSPREKSGLVFWTVLKENLCHPVLLEAHFLLAWLLHGCSLPDVARGQRSVIVCHSNLYFGQSFWL